MLTHYNLTSEQQEAFNANFPIALLGAEGSGKSTICLWRHINNVMLGKKSMFIVTSKSKDVYFKQLCSLLNLNAANLIQTAYMFEQQIYRHPYFDEIIVDDAEDLPIEFFKRIKPLSEWISYNFKEISNIFPNKNTNIDDLNMLFQKNKRYYLYPYHQVYNPFISKLFSNYSVLNKANKNLGKTSYYLSNVSDKGITTEKHNELILSIINNAKTDFFIIAILVPFSSWVDIFYDILTKNKIECSRYHTNIVFDNFKDIHITTFKSSKGIYFDKIIIPNFHLIESDLSSYHLTKHDYFIALTRAKNEIILTSNRLIEDLELLTF